MAYAYTVTQASQETVDGRLYTVFDVVETDAGVADEYTIEAPGIGRLTLVEADLISGTGTSVQPEFGRLAAWTSGAVGHIDQAAAAAASIRIGTDKRFSSDGQVFGRSKVDAGADNVIHSRLTFIQGHD